MRKFFSSIMRRRAIKIYAKRLGPLLKRRYGRSRKYAAEQFRQTVTYAGMPLAHICFAYAMFMPQKDFDALHRELGEACNYQAMRQEIGDLNLAQADLFSFGTGDSSGGGGGDAGGGHGAGGDGGGPG